MGKEVANAQASNLVAFYSLTGHTRALAEEIRSACAGRLEEIVETRPRRGLSGETRALFDSMLRRSPAIAPPAGDPAQFDMLFLGGPVWAGRIAAPVRTYARIHGRRASRVSFFCTYDSDGASTALQELADLCGRRPESVLAVPAHSLVAGISEGELLRFVEPALLQVPAAVAA